MGSCGPVCICMYVCMYACTYVYMCVLVFSFDTVFRAFDLSSTAIVLQEVVHLSA